ncbi:unnamed protein product [Caenorhabditis angaria]|uniref:Sulfotransferase domain-containing protein n=1 Tax=Caenorhabditis angaria TaxID=860376 RepID=A0A9P1ID76_9PELO|nr:unnamed protein product [Caenorhabditis angaria]
MSKCFLTTVLLLAAISISTFYFLNSQNLLHSLKTYQYSKFYEQIVKNQQNLDNLIKKTMDEAEIKGKSLIPAFIDFDREYAIAPYYNLSICRIKKSMSTLMSGISCVLYDTDDFFKNNRSILEVWSRRYCADKNEYRRLNEVKWTMGAAHHTFSKIVVIRNPISRFISFFSNKCIFEAKKYPLRKQCYNCRGNITCFLINQYNRFLIHSSGKSLLKPSYEDRHAAPLSWNCEFRKHFNDYKIAKLSADPEKRHDGIDQLLEYFRESNVPNDTLSYIRKAALEGETKHATFDSAAHDKVQDQIDKDPVIRDYLRRIYLLDFLIFKFDHTILK